MWWKSIATKTGLCTRMKWVFDPLSKHGFIDTRSPQPFALIGLQISTHLRREFRLLLFYFLTYCLASQTFTFFCSYSVGLRSANWAGCFSHKCTYVSSLSWVTGMLLSYQSSMLNLFSPDFTRNNSIHLLLVTKSPCSCNRKIGTKHYVLTSFVLYNDQCDAF